MTGDAPVRHEQRQEDRQRAGHHAHGAIEGDAPERKEERHGERALGRRDDPRADLAAERHAEREQPFRVRRVRRD